MFTTLSCTALTGTHHNRKAFLAAAQRSLLPLNTAGQLAFGDFHSLLQLLCPDFPASVVKNAWSSAVAIQECECVANVRYMSPQGDESLSREISSLAAAILFLEYVLART